jgi:hypothetical protein
VLNLPNKHRNHNLLTAALGLVLGACASGNRAFPAATEPTPHALGRATAAIVDAVNAGADTLAPEPLRVARQRLIVATTEEQAKHAERAALLAREAIADAGYAKAQAERIAAEHARAAAAALLRDVPATPAPGASGP